MAGSFRDLFGLVLRWWSSPEAALPGTFTLDRSATYLDGAKAAATDIDGVGFSHTYLDGATAAHTKPE